MKLSKSNSFRILILLVIAIAEAVACHSYFHKHPISAPMIVVPLAGLVLATILLWMKWLQKRGIFVGAIFTLLAGFATFADWMKGEPLSSLGFGLVFLLAAIQSIRRLLRPVSGNQ